MNKARRKMIRSWKRTRHTLRSFSVIAGAVLIAGGSYTIATSNTGGGFAGAFIILVGFGVIKEVFDYRTGK